MDRTTNVGEIWVQPMTADGQAIPYTYERRTTRKADRFRRDGRWLAYRADETGNFEIYIDAFPSQAARFGSR